MIEENEDEAYETLKGQKFRPLLDKIEVVNLIQLDIFKIL